MTLSPALRFLSNQVWAIHPPVFEALSSLLESRANDRGLPPPPGAVAAEAAPAAGREPGPQIIGDTAVIPVRGVIARYADQINGACQDTGRSAEALQRDLLAMAGDPRVARIVMRIDSPGGTVAGTSETADTIRQVSAGGKPVIAFVDGMAASAAYWLASQADEIVMAGPTSEVGSIGVITAHVDATRAQESRGFKVQVFRTSPLKAPGALGETLTREQAAAIDRDLKDFHAVFAGAVAAGRGLTDEQVTAATTGEMWRPDAAIAMGLADRVATWEQVVGAAAPAPAIASSATRAMAQDEPNHPAASQAATTSPESFMDIKLKAKLAALCQTHPTHAAVLVAEAMKDGATDATLQAHADALVAKAKDDAHAAEVADLKAQVAAANKARDDAKADAEKARKEAAHQAPADPGADDVPAGKITAAKFEAMSPTERAEWVKAHGAESVVRESSK
jgi:signal peptide peptidase SppA